MTTVREVLNADSGPVEVKLWRDDDGQWVAYPVSTLWPEGTNDMPIANATTAMIALFRLQMTTVCSDCGKPHSSGICGLCLEVRR